jgi:glycosyltransferase involved in cell wall biosynthesis
MRGLEVLLIDPSIISGDGHHYAYLNQHRLEFAKLNIGVSAFASSSIERDFARHNDLIPAFQTSLHARNAYTRAEFVQFAENFERDLARVVCEGRFRPDIILLPTADQCMILGLARYIEKSRHKPEVLLWIGTAPHHLKPPDDPSVRHLFDEYREAFSELRHAMGDDSRLHILVEVEGTATAYQPYCGLKIDVVTVRQRLQRQRAPRVRRPDERINLVCAGNAAKHKGYHLLPEAIRQLNAKRNDLRFSIHGTVAYTGFPEAKSILEGLPSLGSNVKVSTATLSPEDYIAWLSDADIVMLPYDTYFYRTSPHNSAVFDESVTLGIPAVAPKGCDFARTAIAEGRAVALESVTAKGLSDAIEIAADHLEELTSRAASYAASQGVDTSLKDTIVKAVAAAEQRLSWLDVIGKRWRKLLMRAKVRTG